MQNATSAVESDRCCCTLTQILDTVDLQASPTAGLVCRCTRCIILTSIVKTGLDHWHVKQLACLNWNTILHHVKDGDDGCFCTQSELLEWCMTNDLIKWRSRHNHSKWMKRHGRYMWSFMKKISNIFIPAGSWSVCKHQIGTKMTIQNVDPDKQVTAVNWKSCEPQTSDLAHQDDDITTISQRVLDIKESHPWSCTNKHIRKSVRPGRGISHVTRRV